MECASQSLHQSHPLIRLGVGDKDLDTLLDPSDVLVFDEHQFTAAHRSRVANEMQRSVAQQFCFIVRSLLLASDDLLRCLHITNKSTVQQTLAFLWLRINLPADVAGGDDQRVWKL